MPDRDNVTSRELSEFKTEVRDELLSLREAVDVLRSGKYLPFFGTATIFVFMAGALWSSVRSLEHEIDDINITMALSNEEIQESRAGFKEEYRRHIVTHRREREGVDRLRDFVKSQFGTVIRIDEGPEDE